MNQVFPHQQILSLGTDLFRQSGAPDDEAAIAMQGLVDSSLMGHDSHGVLRLPSYLEMIEQGQVTPGAPITVDHTSDTTAIVDCGMNFGAVGGLRAIDAGIAMAQRHRVASVVTRRCNHVGRLGAYVERAAEHGLIALAGCNSPAYGHFVLPWGGREGRLATNPLAYGVPSGGDPIVADFATSVAPEGKIQVYRNEGRALPDGWVLDAEGSATNDPAGFYGPPRGGILPLGGSAGHKGYALGLLVELLGAALAGIRCDDPDVFGNGTWFVLLDPAAFVPLDEFKQLVDGTITYMKSSPPAPGFDEVLVPGELEFRSLQRRRVAGIPIDPPTWTAILAHAERLGVTTDVPPVA